MHISFKNKRQELTVVLLIIIIGFLFRLYASFNVPFSDQEIEKIAFAHEINFTKSNVTLPMGSQVTENPPLLPYLMKISFLLFGESKLSAQLPNIVLGTLLLFIIYLLVKENLNITVALLTLVLMSFSQYCISNARHAEENGIILFFAGCVLLFIQRALIFRKKYFLWLAGLFMGFGLLTKGTMITWLPVIIFYVFLDPAQKKIFNKRDLLIFVLIIAMIMLPNILWNMNNGYMDYLAYSRKIDFLFPSLVPMVLFLGEIIIVGSTHLDDVMVNYMTSPEFPFFDWLMGLICVAGAIYFLRIEKNRFIVLLLWLFYFNFVFYSSVRPDTLGEFPAWVWPNKPYIPFHFDNFWWAGLSAIPGIILAAAMLVRLSKHYKCIQYIIPVMLIYFIINAIQFINFPANCFIPRDSVRAEALKKTAKEYTLIGEHDKALKVSAYTKKHYPNNY